MGIGIHMLAEELETRLRARAELAGDAKVTVRCGSEAPHEICRVRLLGNASGFDASTLYAAQDMPLETPPLLALVTQGDETPEPRDGAAIVCVHARIDTFQLLDLASDALEKLMAWDQRMLEAIALRKPTVELLGIATEELSNPVALFDSSTALIGYAGDLPDGYENTIWGAVVTRGFAPLSYYSADEREQAGRQLMSTREPMVTYPRREHGHAHATAMVMVGGRPYAMLSQVDLSSPFTQGQIETLSLVRDRIEQMAWVTVGAQRHASPIEHCLRLLVEGAPVEESVARFHVAERGWHLDDEYTLVYGIAHEELNEVWWKSLHERMREALAGALVIEHEGALVALVHCGSEPPTWGKLAKLGESYNLTFGVSSRFRGFMRARCGFQQAAVAAGLARDAIGITRYDEIFPRRVASLLREHAGADELCDPRLLAFAHSGDPHAGEYLRTLYVYLLCGCNVAKAAKRLYMRRNTLEYRLKRMGEQIGIEVADMDETHQLRLMLSCLLLEE